MEVQKWQLYVREAGRGCEHYGGDLLKRWNFDTRDRKTITNSNSNKTLWFGVDTKRRGATCRETFVHESLHILQCQWGAEQGRYGVLAGHSLAGSEAFREALPKEIGDVYREVRGVTVDYHLAIGMALGRGNDRPMRLGEISQVWQAVTLLQQEQALDEKDAPISNKLLTGMIESARTHVAERFNRVFVISERPGAAIPAIPVAIDTKYAQGAATAVEQLRLTRPAVETDDWRGFARLFCSKWDPSNPLHRAVVKDYPTDAQRYARLFNS